MAAGRLAARAGVSRPFVSLVERGHLQTASLQTVRRVAAVLDIRLDMVARWRGRWTARSTRTTRRSTSAWRGSSPPCPAGHLSRRFSRSTASAASSTSWPGMRHEDPARHRARDAGRGCPGAGGRCPTGSAVSRDRSRANAAGMSRRSAVGSSWSAARPTSGGCRHTGRCCACGVPAGRSGRARLAAATGGGDRRSLSLWTDVTPRSADPSRRSRSGVPSVSAPSESGSGAAGADCGQIGVALTFDGQGHALQGLTGPSSAWRSSSTDGVSRTGADLRPDRRGAHLDGQRLALPGLTSDPIGVALISTDSVCATEDGCDQPAWRSSRRTVSRYRG